MLNKSYRLTLEWPQGGLIKSTIYPNKRKEKS